MGFERPTRPSPRERTFAELFPWRNMRRALMLVAADRRDRGHQAVDVAAARTRLAALGPRSPGVARASPGPAGRSRPSTRLRSAPRSDAGAALVRSVVSTSGRAMTRAGVDRTGAWRGNRRGLVDEQRRRTLRVDRLRDRGPRDVGPGPGRVPPQGPCRPLPRGGGLVGGMGRAGAVIQPAGPRPLRRRAGAGVLPGLAGREGAVGRQHLRVPGDLRLLRGRTAGAAPHPVLGDFRRAPDPGGLHLGGGVPAAVVSFRRVHIRRVPDPDRRPAARR